MRNLKPRTVESPSYADRTCPNFYSENLKCWLRQISAEFFTEEGSPEILRDSIIACLQCDAFPSSALLVVRSVDNGKVLNRENAVPHRTSGRKPGLPSKWFPYMTA